MLKKIFSIFLIILLSLQILPLATVYGADRITYNIHEAAEYKGVAGQNMNVYPDGMYAGSGTGAVFTVFSPADQTYNVSSRITCNVDSNVKINVGNTSLDPVTVNTDGIWEEIAIGTLKLVKGYTSVSLMVESGVISFSDIYFDVTKAGAAEPEVKSTGAFKSHIIPSVIEAEDFDFNSSYSKSSGEVIKQAYRKDSELKITSENAKNLLNMNISDSCEYTFNVLTSAVYDMSAFSNTAGEIMVYFDSNPGYVGAELVASEENSLGSVYLTEGVHKVRIESASDGLNLDSIRFKSSKNNSNYYNPKDLTNGKGIIIESAEETKEANPVWKNLYVSPDGSDGATGSEKAPFATVAKAKEEATKLSEQMKGDIVVNIASGTYFSDKTLEFTTKDSGKNGYNIVYKGTDASNKPQISGGRKIEGWQKTESDLNIWSAKVDEDIEVVRQLYINGFPAEIARSKYLYNGYKAYDDPMTPDKEDGFYIKKKNFPAISNPEDAELAFQYMWTIHFFTLNKITDAGEDWLVEYDQPYFGRYYRRALADCTPAAGIAVFVQNAPELIDKPGEFYFDKKNKMVYYYAYENEDMTTAETYTPYTHVLVNVKGANKDDKVSNIVFNNLGFRHGAWNEVASSGYSPIQSECIADPAHDNLKGHNQHATVSPAQIEMNFADNISVTACDFSELGSTALAMRDCVTNSEIIGNYFRDIAGAAIVVGELRYDRNKHTVEDVTRNIKVKNNVIRRIGHDYYNSTGISVFYANSVDVMHNDIKNTPYTGISVGWGWGDAISNTLKSGEHNIANNRIDHTSMTLHDGASIYTLGEMKGMYIQGNHMSNSRDSGGIYFDQGSASIVARDNVFDDNKINTFFAGALITDIYRNYANYIEAADMTVWNGKANIERPVRTEGDNWGPEARAIIENAGLEEDFEYLLESDRINYPAWRGLGIATHKGERFISNTEYVIWGSDWMEGGEGVAFHEVNDVEPEDYGAKNSILGNTDEGEWVKYKLDVKEPGNYKLDIRYALAFTGNEANASAFTKVTIYLDDVKLCDSLGLESTGSWDARLAKPVTEVNLTEGEHEIKVEFTKGAFAFERLEFISADQKGSDDNYDDGILFKLPEHEED